MAITLLLNNAEAVKKKVHNLAEIIDDLGTRLEYLHKLSVEDLIDFFQEVALFWLKEKSNSGGIYLKNIEEFLEKENLKRSLGVALRGNIRVLDEFADLGDPKLLFHAQPRGLSVQWLAGNVPMLGLFSIISALLTKNPCLVKASSTGYAELVSMLLAFSKVRTNKVDGTEMLKCISVVLIDHADIENQKIMSLSAGTRIVWGGREIVELINELPKQPFCEDVIFGPKYSYALIDKDSLNNSFVKLASRLAIDVSVFDQYACSSPHVVFVETGGVKTALEFSQELAKQLEIVGRTLLPKDNIDTGKALEVVDLRSEYSLRGDRVIAPEGTEWTVVCSNQEGLPAGCYSRFIVVKSIDDFTDLKKFNDRQKQTLGVALTLENKRKWLDQLTVKGIDRCPDLGFATFYESPWDGLFLFDRLIRWVTTYK